MSQPNNNHNPDKKKTITLVGLKLSNHWEPPQTQIQHYMIEQKWSDTLETKVIGLYEETPKTVFETYHDPKKKLIRAPKIKKATKLHEYNLK